MTDKPIVIIPARGGSKRIPKKDIVDFHGKPMIAWTIEAALQSDCFSNVVVSTDCEEIAEVAQAFGAEIPFLREQYADDYSTVSEATCWTIEKMVQDGFSQPDYVVQMMANVPLKTEKTICDFTRELTKDSERSLISCFEPRFSPPQWALAQKEDGTGAFIFDEFLNKRSQDMPELLMPTGAIWGAKWNYLKEHNSFYGPNFRVYQMDWIEALDIDTPEELEICRALFGLHPC